MVTRSALTAENECVNLIFFFLLPVERLLEAVPLLAALLLHCTLCKDAKMGREGASVCPQHPINPQQLEGPCSTKKSPVS